MFEYFYLFNKNRYYQKILFKKLSKNKVINILPHKKRNIHFKTVFSFVIFFRKITDTDEIYIMHMKQCTQLHLRLLTYEA